MNHEAHKYQKMLEFKKEDSRLGNMYLPSWESGTSPVRVIEKGSPQSPHM